jgi:hypothetical protein
VTRYLITPKWKLDRLSDTLKMSRERIRQIGCDGLARIRSTIGEAGAPHKTVRSKSVAALDALVARIEAASTSSDPDAIARLLREEDIAVRPARVPARPLALTAAE